MDVQYEGEKNREFFNRKIEEYDATHATFMKTKNELCSYLPQDVTKILDLGVGTGLELIEIFKKYPNVDVTAIDISEKMLEKLRQRDFSDHIHIIQDNFFDVDFGDDYDAVISTSALHHFLLKDKLVLYKKIYQALKMGGVFLNADKIVNTDLEEEEAIEYYKLYAHEKPHIDRPLSIHHEKEILKEAGFQNINVFLVDKENYRLIRAYK